MRMRGECGRGSRPSPPTPASTSPLYFAAPGAGARPPASEPCAGQPHPAVLSEPVPSAPVRTRACSARESESHRPRRRRDPPSRPGRGRIRVGTDKRLPGTESMPDVSVPAGTHVPATPGVERGHAHRARRPWVRALMAGMRLPNPGGRAYVNGRAREGTPRPRALSFSALASPRKGTAGRARTEDSTVSVLSYVTRHTVAARVRRRLSARTARRASPSARQLAFRAAAAVRVPKRQTAAPHVHPRRFE